MLDSFIKLSKEEVIELCYKRIKQIEDWRSYQRKRYIDYYLTQPATCWEQNFWSLIKKLFGHPYKPRTEADAITLVDEDQAWIPYAFAADIEVANKLIKLATLSGSDVYISADDLYRIKQ